MTAHERAVMIQALNALEEVDGAITALLGSLLGSPDEDAPGTRVRAAITDLRAALAQEQPMLTDDEIYDCRESGYDNDELNSPFSFLEAARAVERKVRGEA